MLWNHRIGRVLIMLEIWLPVCHLPPTRCFWCDWIKGPEDMSMFDWDSISGSWWSGNREKVTVPADLPYLTIQGAGMGATFITWQAIASDIGPDGQPLTAYNSASVIVLANNFVAKDISFKVHTFTIMLHILLPELTASGMMHMRNLAFWELVSCTIDTPHWIL